MTIVPPPTGFAEIMAPSSPCLARRRVVLKHAEDAALKEAAFQGSIGGVQHLQDRKPSNLLCITLHLKTNLTHCIGNMRSQHQCYRIADSHCYKKTATVEQVKLAQ